MLLEEVERFPFTQAANFVEAQRLLSDIVSNASTESNDSSNSCSSIKSSEMDNGIDTAGVIKSSVSAIVYHRDLISATGFDSKSYASFEGVNFRELQRGMSDLENTTNGDGHANQLLDWIEVGLIDAIKKQYLDSFTLGVYFESVNPELMEEMYNFHFFYNKGLKPIQHELNPISMLSLFAHLVKPAANAKFTLRIYYAPCTPTSYCAPLFNEYGFPLTAHVERVGHEHQPSWWTYGQLIDIDCGSIATKDCIIQINVMSQLYNFDCFKPQYLRLHEASHLSCCTPVTPHLPLPVHATVLAIGYSCQALCHRDGDILSDIQWINPFKLFGNDFWSTIMGDEKETLESLIHQQVPSKGQEMLCSPTAQETVTPTTKPEFSIFKLPHIKYFVEIGAIHVGDQLSLETHKAVINDDGLIQDGTAVLQSFKDWNYHCKCSNKKKKCIFVNGKPLQSVLQDIKIKCKQCGIEKPEGDNRSWASADYTQGPICPRCHKRTKASAGKVVSAMLNQDHAGLPEKRKEVSLPDTNNTTKRSRTLQSTDEVAIKMEIDVDATATTMMKVPGRHSKTVVLPTPFVAPTLSSVESLLPSSLTEPLFKKGDVVQAYQFNFLYTAKILDVGKLITPAHPEGELRYLVHYYQFKPKYDQWIVPQYVISNGMPVEKQQLLLDYLASLPEIAPLSRTTNWARA